MLEWIQSNPALTGLIITAFVNLLIDLWQRWFGSDSETELEAKSGFWAGFALIIRGGGLDVVKVVQGIGQILMGITSKAKKVGPAVVLLLGAAALGSTSCASTSKQDVKTAVDIVKTVVEEVCTPDNLTLDACIDRLLSDSRIEGAERQALLRRKELVC